MNWQYTPYALPYLVSAIISLALIIYGWRSKFALARASFIVMTTAALVWCLGDALELCSLQLPDKLFWANVEYLGLLPLPIAWFTFVLQYTRRDKHLNGKSLALLAIIPVITVALVWTNPYHGLIRHTVSLDTSGAFPVMIKTYGAWFWVMVAYSYVLLMTGSFFIFHLLVKPNCLYRKQSVALLLGVLAPWVANLLYFLNISPVYRLDLTSSAFAVTGLALAWGCFKLHLLDIIPVAYDTVIEEMSDGIIVLDRLGRILDLNPAARKIVGKRVSKALDEELARQLKINAGAPYAYTEILLDGRYFDAKTSILKDKHGETSGSLIVLRDITERKHLENQLAQAEKIAALSRFLSGIAHELNNPLTSIMGFSQLLLSKSADESTLKKQLGIINQEADRSKNIVQNLLTFAGQTQLHFYEIDMTHLLDVTLRLREKERQAAGITLYHDKQDIPRMRGDYQQLQRAFLNILINAEQALQHCAEKVISVTTGVQESDDLSFIQVTIADNGSGVAPDDLSKIFDPFFTTKPVGKGMGLGLSISHGIVSHHGGNISVESQPGVGTKFLIKVPVRLDLPIKLGRRRFLEHNELLSNSSDRVM